MRPHARKALKQIVGKKIFNKVKNQWKTQEGMKKEGDERIYGWMAVSLPFFDILPGDCINTVEQAFFGKQN